MNSCFNMPCSGFYILCFLYFTVIGISHAFYGTSYKDNCSSIVPESSATSYTLNVSLPYFDTIYYTGGHKLLLGKNLSYYYNYVRKSLKFPVTPSFYETKMEGVYKVEAWLYTQSPYRNNDYGGSSYRRSRSSPWRSTVKSLLSGFWSKNSGKLCMVGSATWESDESRSINLDVVLKLNYAGEKPNMRTSIVTGTFESVISSTDDLAYFDPISIFNFPVLSNYEYSLVTKELDGGLSGYLKVPKSQSLNRQQGGFCSMWRRSILELWYATECRTTQNCSPLSGHGIFLPRFVTLDPIQCSEVDGKIRYMITFQNNTYRDLYLDFDLVPTWIGEASWDYSSNQLFIVACRIQDPVNYFGNAVEDCTMRLSLRYPSIWNTRNIANIIGQVWTNKTSNDSRHFRKIELMSPYNNGVAVSEGMRYEYTEMDRVRKLCAAKKVVKKGNYPDGHSYDMRFDMSVEHSKWQKLAWGAAIPISVGNELYQGNDVVVGEKAWEEATFLVENELYQRNHHYGSSYMAMSDPGNNSKSPTNISYKINIKPSPGVMVGQWFPIMKWSTDTYGEVEIIAEGVYDPQTGNLCMVGCRKLFPYAPKPTNDSRDCEIHLNFQFPSWNDKRSSLIKGTIGSMRTKADPLYFDDLTVSSTAYYSSEAKQSVQRMDFEITMVLISNTLLCIFIGLQLVHLKQNPVVFSGISLAMLQILSLGHFIPLVLNFKSIFLENSNKQRLRVSTWGCLEANEAAILVITTVAFLLQLRLLQLVWTSKATEVNDSRGSWLGETRTFFVLLPTYIIGGLLTLICKQIRTSYGHQHTNYGAYPNHPLWESLRSYGGLILDGFLLPQVLLNAFRGSAEKMLCVPFYIGITGVRLVPHAYDLCRDRNYPRWHINGAYHYANPAADFYSTAWDIVIPCGSIVLSTMVFLQQRHGGHCILPKRFRELKTAIFQK